MRTANEILQALNRLAPPELKAEWDNVGLLCGSYDAKIQRVLIALDPSMAALQEAAEKHCELLLTHHPILFGKADSVNDGTPTGRAMLFAIQNGITCINLHTNLDFVEGGVNDCLAETLGLQNIRLLHPDGTDAFGRAYGLIRCGTVDKQTLSSFLPFVSKMLNCPGLRFTDGGKSVHKVAVGGGACADELFAVAAAGCDTFVTADAKYHEFCHAAEIGLNLIDAGHFETENPICGVLCDCLQNAFADLEVLMSCNHKNVIRFF